MVKQSNIALFKKFATHPIGVKKNPSSAALSIIKFIDLGMKIGKINRIFLDDFLTIKFLLDNALKNVLVDPSSD